MNDQNDVRTGWFPDPSGRHGERYLVEGRPTELVRDGAQQGIDPLGPGVPPVPVPPEHRTGPAPGMGGLPPQPPIAPPAPTPTPTPPGAGVGPTPAPPPSDGRFSYPLLSPPGPAPSPGGSGKALLVIGGGVAVLLLLLVVAAGLGSGNRPSPQVAVAGSDTTVAAAGDDVGGDADEPPDEPAKSTTSTNRAPTTTTTAKPSRAFDRTTYQELATDPDEFTGSTIDVVGKVFGTVERQGDVVVFQMFADPKNREWNTVVSATDPGFPIVADDYVRVTGMVLGDFEGTNAFGGSVSAVSVVATTVEKTDASAAASPALREAIGGSLNQHGLVVTVDKVQFAADETRVFVTVANSSGASASFYSYSAKAVRGSTQYEQESAFGSGYPTVPSEILAGVSASGIVVFPAMDPNGPLTVVLTARNDNYRLDFDDYTITAQ